MDTTMLIPLLERLGWTSLQTVLLVALVYGVCRALPSLSAATRCRLWWLVSLQAVLGLFWSQPLQLAWLPAPQAVAMTATDVAADLVYPLAPEASAQLLATMPVPAADVPAVAWWAVALAALWASGVLLMALRTFGEWRRCRALLAAAYPCEDEALVQALQLASDAHGVRPAPRLWMSAQVDAPQLVGPFRPVLLLPAGDNALQGDALDLALTHELQHLQRRDLQWGLLPALAQHLFFFHPLLRLSVREYAQAREEAVDAAVVGQHGASRQAYGRLLLQLGVAPQPHLGVASAAPNTTSLKRRLLSLQSRRSCPRILAMALTAVVVLVGVAPMRLVAAPVPPAPPAPPAAPKAVVPPPPKAPNAPPAAPSAARVPAVPVAPAPPAEPADVEALSGPDDADVAVDVDVDVDTDMHSEHSTSHTTSITTYGRLDLGKSPLQAYVLVDGDSTFANGGIDDVTVARRQLGKGPALWFRQGDKRYVVRDPMLIQTLQRAYSGAADLGRQQSELGRQQSALGREQGELGRQMGEMGRLQGEESRRLALAAAEVARSAMAAHDINREAAAEAAKAARGATSDMAVAREAAREAAAEARRAMQEARSEAAQSGRTRDMQRLASQQSELASRQAALGSQQAALGERQARVHAQASQQAQQVIARALASGRHYPEVINRSWRARCGSAHPPARSRGPGGSPWSPPCPA
ncbi:Regulatory protein BlaR1 [Stenotrophomonas maltophilia]|nr:Regulatory protein BlaR1 [Stenotrophomonas maltophilia]